jgi:uncharacterized protein YkwD
MNRPVLSRRAALAVASILACTPAVLAAPRTAAPPARGESAQAAASITAFRGAQALGPVVSDPQLVKAAEAQARGMAAAGQMSHDVAGSFSSRIKAAGIRAYAAAENVAMGQASLAEALADWQKSAGHRKNLLLSAATRIGLAKAVGQGPRGAVQYWALILAGPEPRADQPPPGAATMPTMWFGNNRP